MRIKVSGELGTAVMSLAVIGLYYGAASFLVENVILRNLTEEERDEHILSTRQVQGTFICAGKILKYYSEKEKS